LAYQYGAGIMDLVTPTNGAIMAVLAASGTTYKEWIQATWKPTAIIFLIGIVSVFVSIYAFG